MFSNSKHSYPILSFPSTHFCQQSPPHFPLCKVLSLQPSPISSHPPAYLSLFHPPLPCSVSAPYLPHTILLYGYRYTEQIRSR